MGNPEDPSTWEQTTQEGEAVDAAEASDTTPEELKQQLERAAERLATSAQELQAETEKLDTNLTYVEEQEAAEANPHGLRRLAEQVKEKYDQIGRNIFFATGLATMYTSGMLTHQSLAFGRNGDPTEPHIPSSMPDTWGELLTGPQAMEEGLDITSRVGVTMAAITALATAMPYLIGRLKEHGLVTEAEAIEKSHEELGSNA